MKNKAKLNNGKKQEKGKEKRFVQDSNSDPGRHKTDLIFFPFLIYYQHVRLSSILFLVFPSLLQRGLTA